MKYPKITAAKIIDDQTLLVEFSNREKKKYTITKLLDKPMFLPLKNPAFFKNFTVDSSGCAIIWNEDIDLSEYEIWKNGSIME